MSPDPPILTPDGNGGVSISPEDAGKILRGDSDNAVKQSLLNQVLNSSNLKPDANNAGARGATALMNFNTVALNDINWNALIPQHPLVIDPSQLPQGWYSPNPIADEKYDDFKQLNVDFGGSDDDAPQRKDPASGHWFTWRSVEQGLNQAVNAISTALTQAEGESTRVANGSASVTDTVWAGPTADAVRGKLGQMRGINENLAKCADVMAFAVNAYVWAMLNAQDFLTAVYPFWRRLLKNNERVRDYMVSQMAGGQDPEFSVPAGGKKKASVIRGEAQANIDHLLDQGKRYCSSLLGPYNQNIKIANCTPNFTQVGESPPPASPTNGGPGSGAGGVGGAPALPGTPGGDPTQYLGNNPAPQSPASRPDLTKAMQPISSAAQQGGKALGNGLNKATQAGQQAAQQALNALRGLTNKTNPDGAPGEGTLNLGPGSGATGRLGGAHGGGSGTGGRTPALAKPPNVQPTAAAQKPSAATPVSRSGLSSTGAPGAGAPGGANRGAPQATSYKGAPRYARTVNNGKYVTGVDQVGATVDVLGADPDEVTDTKSV